MIKVVPAIIPHTKEQFTEEIRKVAGFAQLVQIDISDGVFVPTKTWPYNGRDADFFEKLKSEEEGWPRWEDVEFEIHLMVKNPEEVVLDWIHSGASAIIAHIEATTDFQKVIDLCRGNNVSVGIAIKPATNETLLEPFIEQVDFIQYMGSDMLGKHGVELDKKALEKIKKLKNLYPLKEIAVDIGVNEDTKDEIIDSGVSKLVAGSAIFESEDLELAFDNLSS